MGCLGDAEAVLVVDETGLVKKGSCSAGVARQYSGTVGKVGNGQVGMFLAYASDQGQALLDRALYLPKSWTEEPQRCRAAWVTGDHVYGDSRDLRRWLEAQGQAHVRAVTGKEHVWSGWRQPSVTSLLQGLDESAWRQLSAGSGRQGERYHDWPCVALTSPPAAGWFRALLARRRLRDGALTASVA